MALNPIAGATDTPEQRKVVLDVVLRGLGIVHLRHVRFGDLSGGQKKRVTIAAYGMLKGASIIILDEVSGCSGVPPLCVTRLRCAQPTSGLSSTDAGEVMQFLSKYALATGATIVLTIHQPPAAIVSTLDSVTVLHRGKLMYARTAGHPPLPEK